MVRHSPSPAFDPRGAYADMETMLSARFAIEGICAARPPSSRAQLLGGHISRSRGRGMEFEEVRAFQAGDDVRSVDWRVTARRGGLHTKIFREERERPVFIITELVNAGFFGSRHRFKSVAISAIAAMLAWSGLKLGDRVGGMILGDTLLRELRPARSRSALLRLLSELVSVGKALKTGITPDPELSLSDVLAKARDLTPSGGVIWLICNFCNITPEVRNQLRRLNASCDVGVIAVYDSLERELPLPGVYRVRDAHGSREVNTHGNTNRARYTDQFEAQRLLNERELGESGIPVLTIDASTDLAGALKGFWGIQNNRRRSG